MAALLNKIPRALWVPAAIATLVSGAVLGIKELGLWEAGELAAYDQATRWRSNEATDQRVLVIGITEADIGKYQDPLPDGTLNQALNKLIEAEVAAIGLDIVRDQASGELLGTLQNLDNPVIPICSHGGKASKAINSPPNVDANKVGFADVPVDADGITRRLSLFATSGDATSGCQAQKSLALQLAESYMFVKQPDLEPKLDEVTGRYSLGKASFEPLTASHGGYQKTEVTGYPLLLKYRHPTTAVATASLADLLENRIPDLKDRVVLVGYTASSKKDVFRTPYSGGLAEHNEMPGVMVHAQATSQLISSALDARSPLGSWPQWLEGLLLGGFALTGAYAAWWVRHPAKLAGTVTAATALPIGAFGGAFVNSLWLPVISPVVALWGAAFATGAWQTYQTNQNQQRMLQLTKNQEQTIDALKQLLSQQPTTGFSSTPTVSPSSFAASDLPLLSNRYQTVGVLGAGGFATTYKAKDMNRPSHPQCAIKHLTPARRDPAFVDVSRRLFTTEAEILEKLGSHPQIPNLLAYFEENNEFFLVQELIEGRPLDVELAERSEPWTQAQVIDLLQQMLPVLDYIHGQRVIHRDIKPSNIIRRPQGEMVLIDFGAVKEINPQNASSPTVAIGTRGYTPAEQFAGRPTFSSDVYALGMVAVEAATACSPQELDVDEATGKLQWQNLAPLSPPLIALIDKMVAYHGADRYQSARDVLQALQPLLQNDEKGMETG
jgi:CHASE2 domain-containing sensor protein/predicted Ser/Thr protein kinase